MLLLVFGNRPKEVDGNFLLMKEKEVDYLL